MLGTSDSAQSTAVEASAVVLVMTGFITFSMITKAFGNLPGEEQSRKRLIHGSVGRGAWQQTFLGAGLCNGDKEHAWAHTGSFFSGKYLQGVRLLKQQVGV